MALERMNNLQLQNEPSQNEPGVLIRAKNLGVYYESDTERRDDFKSHVHRIIRGERQNDIFWALNDISFTGYTGDVLGVIGPNGAGKTTLCRAIAGLLRPNRGSLEVKGSVSALLSLGTGFDQELTGNENIYLNGMMLGFSRRQINELLPLIQEFSGLGRFLDQPLKYYSSGMKARLGFSIASVIEAEILVIDEVLGTGDMEFNEKAVQKVWELVSGARMVLVVTHETEFIKEHCSRALWIENGSIKASGDPLEVAGAYEQLASGTTKPKKKKLSRLKKTRQEKGEEKAIEARDLSLEFKLNKKPFRALDNLGFDVFEREIIGIIGPNGAGKTTLCRTLCGIYKQDYGKLKVNGTIAALLSFGTGFNPQLSGYDNIYLNGMMLGIPRQTIRKVEDEIIEFSELDQFIDQPVKHYSKGMRSRLGFSIASMLKPDIFIVDEALSAGDIAFQEKAAARMQEMLEEAKAVLIVTHSMKIVKKVCTRALLMDRGRIIFDGDPLEAVEIYRTSVKKKKKK